MKVSELIAMLNDQDPNAEVLIMSQPNWPFEIEVDGVVSREQIVEEAKARKDYDEDDDCASYRDGGPNDVFLVEGNQLRYGSKLAWDIL